MLQTHFITRISANFFYDCNYGLPVPVIIDPPHPPPTAPSPKFREIAFQTFTLTRKLKTCIKILNVFNMLWKARKSNTSTYHFLLHALFSHCIKLTCNSVYYTAVLLPAKMVSSLMYSKKKGNGKRFRLLSFATRVGARMAKYCRCRQSTSDQQKEPASFKR